MIKKRKKKNSSYKSKGRDPEISIKMPVHVLVNDNVSWQSLKLDILPTIIPAIEQKRKKKTVGDGGTMAKI